MNTTIKALYCNLFKLFRRVPFIKQLWSVEKSGVRCLLLHQINPNDFDRFQALLRKLDKEFGFITPLDFFAFLAGDKAFSGTKLLLTFDDGFKSNRIVADQVLRELGIKAIFFICPGIAEAANEINPEFKSLIQQNVFDGQERSLLKPRDFDFLNWDDLRALIEGGHWVGAHALAHKRLSTINDGNELTNEIVLSKAKLEEQFNFKIECFAYPFGDNPSICATAYHLIKKHFKYCFTGLRGLNVAGADLHYLLRDQIEIADDNEFIRNILNGMMDWFYRLKLRGLKRKTRG